MVGVVIISTVLIITDLIINLFELSFNTGIDAAAAAEI